MRDAGRGTGEIDDHIGSGEGSSFAEARAIVAQRLVKELAGQALKNLKAQ